MGSARFRARVLGKRVFGAVLRDLCRNVGFVSASDVGGLPHPNAERQGDIC